MLDELVQWMTFITGTEGAKNSSATAQGVWLQSWATTVQNSKKFQSLESKWFDGEFSKLIETTFRGRIILTQKEASARFRKTSRREITEDE